jgi:hypothetical protein
MISNQEIKDEVYELYLQGEAISFYEGVRTKNLPGFVIPGKIFDEQYKKIDKKFEAGCTSIIFEYQEWYFKSLQTVKQLAPDRLYEFTNLYQLDKVPKNLSSRTYSISDYFSGLISPITNPYETFQLRIMIQISIIKAIYSNLDSLLIDIKGVIQDSFFTAEIKVAEDLFRKKHLRASGAICGVVLENHFASVCENHKIEISKKNPSISIYNDAMKKHGVIDQPAWRQIALLGEIRNYCVHQKDRDPALDEIKTLIRGCKKIMAEVS